jgi:glucosamine--fructose-6-phosphate aminotransferase (isomerizing)
MEGALKLKESLHPRRGLSRRRAQRHGPLALVDHDMPVVAVANNRLLEKLISNIEGGRARGGRCSSLPTHRRCQFQERTAW